MTKMKKLIVAILLVVFTMGVASFAACDKPEQKSDNTYYFYRLYLDSTSLTLGDVYDVGDDFYQVVMKKSYVKCTLKDDGTAMLIINKALTSNALPIFDDIAFMFIGSKVMILIS